MPRPNPCCSERWRSRRKPWVRNTRMWPPPLTTWRISTASRAGMPKLSLWLNARWHPQRFTEVERMLQKRNLRYEKKSQMNGREGSSADAIFLDTLGDLPAFYYV